MENKKITYIVFKDYNETTTQQDGIVFFEDGTYKKIKNNRKTLINYLMQYAKQENIERKSELFYNNDKIIHLNNKTNEQELINKLIEKSKEEKIDNMIEGLGEKITQETARQISEEDEEIEDDIEEQIKKDKEKTLFARFKKKSKKFKVTVTAIGLSVAIALGAGGYKLVKNLISKNQKETNKNSQDKYSNMSYDELLNCNKTSNTQKIEMTKVGQLLDYFNRRFANNHTEKNKNIKAALTWDEAIALNLVYNDHTTKEIGEIFNGCTESSTLSEIENFDEAYNQALIQLTKAYVLEDKNATIGLDNLINEPKGKAFYAKYHNLFMLCKNSKGQNQINNVNNFYKELLKDFDIENNINTNNNQINIESYKLSIIPMISASEILFQNLEIDNTMSDQVITYFNDLNLCKLATEKLNQYQATITLSTTSDYHLHYNLFKEQKIEELSNENAYYISDELRDLTKLTLFNNIISSYNSITPTQNQEAYLDNTTQNTSYNKSETSKITDRDTAIKEVGEENVKEAEIQANNTTNSENEREKQKEEQLAEEKRKELQVQEDKKKEQLEKEVSDKNKELEEKIDDINKEINDDKDVNEKDFGTTEDGENIVDIDDEYIDTDGNINDSIKDITTDINQNIIEPLPTPTDDGAEDGYGNIYINSDQIITEEVELTDEQIADMIIESMTNQSQISNENSKTYTYTK